MDLAEFIDTERATIVAEWETFARSLPATSGMTSIALRDHADEILSAIVNDMRSRQTDTERSEKSKGRGTAQQLEEVGKVHAMLRIEFGFKVSQMVAEYRALRTGVLRLWESKGTDPCGVTRFNESIDEALTEGVYSFVETTEHFRDQSLGILSHDLRDPLSGIVMGATMMMSSEELSDTNARIAARILNSANRMSRMIGDLLDLTRTRFGNSIPIVPTETDLAMVCRQVIAELEGLGTESGLVFTGEGDLRGQWDGDRISQVVSNLLRNAILYGEPTEPISLVAKDNGSEVVLEVHNGGPAIPQSAQATIFEPMVRHAGKEHKTTGLGLGLYIAAQIVHAHGGTLRLTSTGAEGTTFSAHLPRVGCPKEAPRGPTSAEPDR